MRKLAAVLVASVAVLGCGDDDDDDDDNNGTGSGSGSGSGSASAYAWDAVIVGTGMYGRLAGEASVVQTIGAQSFDASISLRNDTPGALRPWHVHLGRCASGGAIVGGDTTYPRLLIAADGTSSSRVSVPTALDPFTEYHVNVHFSDADLGNLIACGDLVRSQ